MRNGENLRQNQCKAIIGWIKLHNGKLHNFCPSLNIVRQENEIGCPCSIYFTVDKHIQNFIMKPKSKIPRRKPECRRKDDIKMELEEIMCEGLDWVHLTQNRIHNRALLSAVMNLRIS
jgi:hypothetical protein